MGSLWFWSRCHTVGCEAGSTGRVRIDRIERSETAPTTIAPPKSASGLGISPIKRRTHNGLRIGSRVWMRMASTAVSLFMASEMRIEGRPI